MQKFIIYETDNATVVTTPELENKIKEDVMGWNRQELVGIGVYIPKDDRRSINGLTLIIQLLISTLVLSKRAIN